MFKGKYVYPFHWGRKWRSTALSPQKRPDPTTNPRLPNTWGLEVWLDPKKHTENTVHPRRYDRKTREKRSNGLSDAECGSFLRRENFDLWEATAFVDTFFRVCKRERFVWILRKFVERGKLYYLYLYFICLRWLEKNKQNPQMVVKWCFTMARIRKIHQLNKRKLTIRRIQGLLQGPVPVMLWLRYPDITSEFWWNLS